MRRRVLMVLLWLAGTLGATTTVFATVSSVSNDLFDVGNPRNAAPTLGRGTLGFASTTTVAESLPTTTIATTEAPTTEPEPTTVVTEPVAADETVATDPEPDPGPVATTTPRGTTVRTTVSAGPPATTAPAVTLPPTTEAPAVTEPPTTVAPPPPTTPASVSCTQPTPKAVGRNVIYYRPCTDGLRYSSAVPQAGWTAVVVAKGPPSLSVTFSNGSTSLTCTLSADGDGIVTGSGDC